jgi:transcriptional regulator with XRE-family HTH domain
MTSNRTTEEIEADFGRQIRSLRLRKNVTQIELAQRAGVALGALKNLELGKGATLKTLIRVLRALDRLQWLETIAPVVSISPLQMIKANRPARRRASPKR